MNNPRTTVSCHHRQRRHLSTVLKSKEIYDCVVVGAGSAGCIIANRLSEDRDSQVLLMEAGPEDKSWKFHMPAALMYTLTDPAYNWCYYTTPQKHMDNRQMYWPRGKVWGGSSSENAMVYIRGHPCDFDRWEAEGATGWSFADCLPYFKKSTTHELGEDEYRGGSGLQHVSQGTSGNPLHEVFIKAGIQAGYPFTKDVNGYQQEGFGYFDMTIQKGIRSSTSTCYLRPALYRENFSIRSNVLTTKILFEGKRAIGVEYIQYGELMKVYAKREVILCSGSINSPQILLLSGVGNADDLGKLDIPLVHHLPGVGQNLQDHLEVYVQHKCTKPLTLYTHQWKFPVTMIRTGIEWFLTQTGIAATTHLESGGFIRSRPGVPHPDIQFHFLPSVIIDHGQKMGDCHAFQVHVGTMRPTSRGTLTLASRDPTHQPFVDPNYLATEEDREDLRTCIRLTREIFAQRAFDVYRGPEMQPGSRVQSDQEIDAFVRAKGDSAYHPSCTCKMGQPSDTLAVVDPKCQVIGLEGLRVVDASIMPSVASGNLNAPTIMLAEKAADIIRGKPPLPKSNAPVWKPQTLKTQR